MKKKSAKKKAKSAAPDKEGKRAKNKKKTQKAILKAALASFAKNGFHHTTTKEISEKAGIAEGTLFNYFRTKEDLALYFFEEEIDGLVEWFGAETHLQNAPVTEKLFAITHHHLERVAPYEDFIGAVYLRALQPNSRLSPLSLERADANQRFLQFIRGILSDAEEAGEIPTVGDLGAYAFGLFQLAMLTHWLHDQSPGKENTLAMLDRCLNIAKGVLQKGSWEW